MDSDRPITRYFTFGFDHTHEGRDGFVFDRDVLVEITDVDPRGRMLKRFGQRWAFDYTPEDIAEWKADGRYERYCPRGTVVL